MRSRKLLIATGVCDNLPRHRGIARAVRPQRVPLPVLRRLGSARSADRHLRTGSRGRRAVAGVDARGAGTSFCAPTAPPRSTPRSARSSSETASACARARSAGLEGRDGILQRIVFDTGRVAARGARCSSRPGSLSNRNSRSGSAARSTRRAPCAPANTNPRICAGLYVAGDASRAVQWVIVAAAEGAEAAFAINTDLIREDLALISDSHPRVAIRSKEHPQEKGERRVFLSEGGIRSTVISGS